MPLPAPPPAPRQFVPVFAKVVNSTFGGGSTILGVFRRELVERRGWLTEDRFNLSFGVSRVTPGTSVLAFCAAAGWSFGSWRGAVFALLAASLPCTFIAVGMLLVFDRLEGNFWFSAALRGAMASAIGIMLASGWQILKPFLKPSRRLRNTLLFATSIVLMLVAGLSPISILGLSALAGFLLPEKGAA